MELMAPMKKTGHLTAIPETGQNLTNAASDPLSGKVLDWQPSLKQAAVLAEAAKGGLGRTITAVCQAAGVSRDSFYRWMREDGFRNAWREVACQIVEVGLPGVTNAVVQEAISGNMTAARLHLQASGMIGSGGVNLHVGDKIDKQLNVATHLDLIPRASNMTEWLAIKKAMEKAMAEAEAEEAAAAKVEAIDVVEAGDAA